MPPTVATSIAALPPREQVLLVEARSGSVTALGQLFESARCQMLAAVRRSLPAAVRAKVGVSDIVQEAVIDAQRGFPAFTGRTPTEFFGWLRCILRRRLVDNVRRYECSRMRNVRLEVRLVEISHGQPGASLAARQQPPDRSVIRREEAAVIGRAMASLSADCQTVIRLRYWDQQPFSEIAKAMDKSEAAVRKIWYRGLQRLGAIVRDAAVSAADEPSRSWTAANDAPQPGARRG